MDTHDPVRSVPTHFTRDGFSLTQIWREGDWAIYAQRRALRPRPEAFEVVRLCITKAHPRDADQTRKERYPSANEWGSKGWTCLSEREARECVTRHRAMGG